MEQATLDFIHSLPLSDDTKMALMTTLEWEKELSWSEGYADAIDTEEETIIEENSADEFVKYLTK